MVERRHDMGPVGQCICPKCGHRTLHRSGVPCQDERCPTCGARMLREGSEHHRLFQAKHGKGAGDVEPSD